MHLISGKQAMMLMTMWITHCGDKNQAKERKTLSIVHMMWKKCYESLLHQRSTFMTQM